MFGDCSDTSGRGSFDTAADAKQCLLDLAATAPVVDSTGRGPLWQSMVLIYDYCITIGENMAAYRADIETIRGGLPPEHGGQFDNGRK